ncbi:MAG: class I SAM-dependent methyltransferase [Parvibaculaceae bacterium]
MINIRQFGAENDVVDAEAIQVFQAQWNIYQKLVDSDNMGHRDVGRIVRTVLTERFAEPFAFLDIACGDSSVAKAALAGTSVRHYLGIDLAKPALDLAARNLADQPYDIDLHQRDFVAAMAEGKQHADAIWCGLSLHHLATSDKLAVFRGIRDAAGDRGVFLAYEPILEDGESHERFLDRTWRTISTCWTSLSPAELDQIWRHIRSCDRPETEDTWLNLGREAGFAAATQVFEDRTGLYRMFRYDLHGRP